MLGGLLAEATRLVLVVVGRAQVAVEQVGDGAEGAQRRVQARRQHPLAQFVVEAQPYRRRFVAVLEVKQPHAAVRAVEDPHLYTDQFNPVTKVAESTRDGSDFWGFRVPSTCCPATR